MSALAASRAICTSTRGMLVLALFLGAAGSLVAWQFLGASQQPAPPPWRFLPDQSVAVVAIDVESFRTSRVATEGFEQLAKVKSMLDQNAMVIDLSEFWRSPVPLNNVRRTSMGINAQGEAVMEIQTLKPMAAKAVRTGLNQSASAFLKGFQKEGWLPQKTSGPRRRGVAAQSPKDADQPDLRFTAATVGPYTIYDCDSAGASFCLPDDHTVVFSSPAALRKVLARNRPADFVENLDSVLAPLNPASGFILAVAIPEMKSLVEQRVQGFFGQGFFGQGAFGSSAFESGPASLLRNARAASLELDLSKGIRIGAILRCKDEQEAAVVKILADGGLAMTKVQLKDAFPDEETRKNAERLLGLVEVQTREANVKLSFDVGQSVATKLVQSLCDYVGEELRDNLSPPVAAGDAKPATVELAVAEEGQYFARSEVRSELLKELSLRAMASWNEPGPGIDGDAQAPPPSLGILLELSGDPAAKALGFGFFQFTSAEDDRGRPLKFHQFTLNLSNDRLTRVDRSDKSPFAVQHPSGGVSIPLEFDHPDGPAKAVGKLAGTFRLVTGGRPAEVVLEDPWSLAGKAVERPELKAAGVRLKLKRDWLLSLTGTKSLTVEISGNRNAVESVQLLDAEGKPYDDAGAGTEESQGRLTSSFDFEDRFPPKAKLKVALRVGASEISVPFQFQNLKIAASDERTTQ